MGLLWLKVCNAMLRTNAGNKSPRSPKQFGSSKALDYSPSSSHMGCKAQHKPAFVLITHLDANAGATHYDIGAVADSSRLMLLTIKWNTIQLWQMSWSRPGCARRVRGKVPPSMALKGAFQQETRSKRIPLLGHQWEGEGREKGDTACP